MKITNNHNLPQPIINYLANRQYSKKGADISTTELIGSPRISVLKAKHWHDIERDAMDMIWSLFGTAVHDVLATGSDQHNITEEDVIVEIEGWRVKGGMDLQNTVLSWSGDEIGIDDWKVTKAWTVQRALSGEKTEWEQQLNIYAQLVRMAKGAKVTRLGNWCIVKDWTESRVGQEFYPPQPITYVEWRVWSEEEAMEYILSRIQAHKDARMAMEFDESIPHCSDEERWKREDRYAAYTNVANVKPSKIFDTLEEAEAWLKEKNPKTESKIEKRAGSYVRCEKFCDVSDFCEQWAADRPAQEATP